MRVRRALLMAFAAGVWLSAAPIASGAEPAPTSTSTSAATASPTSPNPASLPNAAAGDQAQQAKDAADRRVAALARSIASESKQLAALSTMASLAEQRFITQQSVQARARITETLAEIRLSVSRAQYRAAHDALVAIAVSAYQSGSAPGSFSTSSFASLLTVSDPGEVLSGATEQRMLADHQVDIVSRVTLALQTMRSAERTQKAALETVTRETARLDRIRRQADTALAASRRTVIDLKANLVRAKASQKQADAALSTFLGGWSVADPARAGMLNSQYEAIALNVRHAKPAPHGTHWTPAIGQTVVNRALQYLGTDYAWAAGNATGPTQGMCVAGSASNDCHHTGFDCSGLALYAWAPYLSMTHNAASQYSYGTLHPAPTALLPGDLVFWSSDHTVAGIHHVAIYVGNGNVIQAPQSGDIVRITPLNNVSSGYFAATRPMS